MSNTDCVLQEFDKSRKIHIGALAFGAARRGLNESFHFEFVMQNYSNPKYTHDSQSDFSVLFVFLRCSMVAKCLPLSVHRTIVQAGKRYDKLPAHKRIGKNVYLQAQCGHLVDSEGWEALLKRAKKCVDEAKQTTTKVNETKAVRFLDTSCMLLLVGNA